MKKLWLLVALVALAGTAVSTYADVQNIRISGDIRIRAYYTVNHDGDDDSVWDDAHQVKNTDSYISQRTRVSIEADLEDHVLVVVTLKAEGLWGQDNQTDDVVDGSGAGTADRDADDDLFESGDEDESAINRRWDVGITEAYVQFSEMFYSPATLKLGRQYLHYGRGLIISANEQEYNFDAARLVLDYYPTTVDVVYAMIDEDTPFGGSTSGSAPNDAHLLFVNARHELTDSAIKNIEAYFGWLINSQDSLNSTRRALPTTGGASPLIVGARADISLTENLDAWIEGVYETGPDGFVASESIEAYLVNAGAELTLEDVELAPVFNVNYIYASGGGHDGKNMFRPWFDYSDGYNGYVFSPLLSNIHILNLGVTVTPCENTTLAFQAYAYRRADGSSTSPVAPNPNIDNGGLGFTGTADDSKEIGYELDTILGYDYSKDVALQLVYGVFFPANSVQGDSGFGAAVAHEVRGEVNVRF